MNGTSNNQGQQKISGKAWGVLVSFQVILLTFSPCIRVIVLS